MANPFIPGDTKYKFNISLVERENRHGTKNYWVHDWRPDCQEWDGSFIKMVMKYKGFSYFEAIKDVCGEDLSFTLFTPKEEEEKAPEVEIVVQPPSDATSFREKQGNMLRDIALRYLSKRCISEETAIKHSLSYTASAVVFPYFEYGMLVYWQLREILSKRFLFPSSDIGCTKDQFLYGFDQIEPGDSVYITESIIDSLTIGDSAVAFGGDSFSSTQLRKLRSLSPGRVIIAPDRDDAGKALVKKFFFLARDFFPDLHMILPPTDFKDWNELDQSLGLGASRDYVENHSIRLTPPAIFNLSKY